jgi:prepilin-type N-terminal cleavage/methylation domain-containing protein
MRLRHGFTLLEMLISTVLLSLVLLGLYGALNMQQRSTKHLFEFLTNALDADRGVLVLYRDIFQSDGNITLKNGEFDRLCLNSTSHSLHGLALAKVCWIVAKEDHALLRIEGNGYRLPLRYSDGVEIDRVMGPVELFDVQKDKKNVLVGLQQTNRDPYVFVVQGVEPPPKIVKKKPKKKLKPKPKTKLKPKLKPKPDQPTSPANNPGEPPDINVM